MSSFEPNKRHLRELLIYFFNLKKFAAEAHRLLVKTYCEAALSERSCRASLDQDSCQTQEELAGTLGVTQQAISHRLKSFGMIQKQGNWIPYELTPRNVECRFSTCVILLARHK